uniref:Uncharacterized protein n=1 Tax=Oryza barthii TaxID=65489 RepID=A0A0D3HC60_9ORYZ
MSQPEDSDTAKMLKYTEAHTNRKLVLRQKRTFELEDEPWNLNNLHRMKDDYEDVKPIHVVKRLCTRIIFLMEGRFL